MLKHKMKDREFQDQQAMSSAVAKMWNDLTFADVQRVFQEWMERLAWVVGNNGEYYPNEKYRGVEKSLPPHLQLSPPSLI
jgi:hypothetical protein